VIREALRLHDENERAPPTRRARKSPKKEEIVALKKPLRQRGLTSLALFGSVVRGTARPDSDIVVLVDVAPDAQFSLIDLVAVKDFLEDQRGRRVDVVTRGGLEPAIRACASRGPTRVLMEKDPAIYVRCKSPGAQSPVSATSCGTTITKPIQPSSGTRARRT
jgi:predicted nucleotidyltransferase